MTARRCAVLFGVCLAATAVFLGAGCEQDTGVQVGAAEKKSEPADQMWAQKRPPIADLPIPVGFKLNEGQSRSFAAAGARYVDHLYKGKGDKFAVARFYKSQMPRNRWVLVTDMFIQGEVVLDFEKETERCRVVLSGGGGLLDRVRLHIVLWTSGRIPIPAGTKKKK